jgi:hypothetical protein
MFQYVYFRKVYKCLYVGLNVSRRRRFSYLNRSKPDSVTFILEKSELFDKKIDLQKFPSARFAAAIKSTKKIYTQKHSQNDNF